MRPRHAFFGVAVPLLLAGAAWRMSGGRPDAEPVAEYPVRTGGARLALILAGDAGLTPALRALARHLADNGVPSVVLTTTGWPESPGAASAEVGIVARTHLATWARDRLLLLGTARGAGMAPFVANRMERDLRERVDAVVLLDPPERVSFQRRWRRPWRASPRPTDLPILPELERMRGIPLLCLYRRDDRDAFCPALDPALARREPVAERGKVARDGDALAARVLAFAR